MRRLSHDFFSDPLWPHEHASALEVNKSHSSEESMRDEARDKENMDSATAASDCIAQYIKVEELSNSIELLSNHHDSPSEQHQQRQSSRAGSEQEDSDDELLHLSAQI